MSKFWKTDLYILAEFCLILRIKLFIMIMNLFSVFLWGRHMKKDNFSVRAEFSRVIHIDPYYHANHSQLLHYHEDELELLYIMEGEGSYIVDGRKYAVRSGNIIICNAKVLHGEAAFSSNSMESYCCVLKHAAIDNLDDDEFRRITQNPVLNFQEDKEGFEYLIKALNSLSEKEGTSKELQNQIAGSILYMVCEKLLQRHQQDGVLRKSIDDFIDSVIKYLEAHYKETITLNDLGKKFHISHYYLSHIFKEQTGYSPIKYAAQLRVGEAQRLLMYTEKSIGDIGEELGFNDNCHFNVMFKKYTGLAPSKYRQYFKKNIT